MKKYIIAIALGASSAMALAEAPAKLVDDITITNSHNYASDQYQIGVAAGKQFGNVRGELSATRAFTDSNRVSTFGIRAQLPVASVGPFVVAGTAGLVYNSVSGAKDGMSLVTGAEVSYSLTPTLKAVAVLERVTSQSRVNFMDGNKFGIGLRASF
jgi:hypothetical protein